VISLTLVACPGAELDAIDASNFRVRGYHEEGTTTTPFDHRLEAEY
jgi:phosphoketolase